MKSEQELSESVSPAAAERQIYFNFVFIIIIF
ncbi:hypothetical protein PARMER_03539 [Parabacteroides merdae ATCC 43184]|nr:hypothetical protein PARMER_03539 [Parabacteroides merdae ATCC 43184]